MRRRDLARRLLNIPGWRSKRKIVVFESDDWGSIRMPSPEIKKRLINQGIRVDKLSYNNYDSLESEKDLACLIDELSMVKDKNGNPCLFTLNTIVANPDFKKIKESNYTRYFHEVFTETLKRYPSHQQSFRLLLQGISSGVFRPQLHGREHVNVNSWLKALRENVGHVRMAFDYGMFDLSINLFSTEGSFMRALNYDNPSEIAFHKEYLIEGADIFEQIFGYRSKSFIAPKYTWSRNLNITLKNCGIHFLQGEFYQLHPTGKKLIKLINYTGKRNSLGQIFLVRNVSFEPSENPTFDWVGTALAQISEAFFWNKPAIISSHRANYIGYIEPENRRRNLILLRRFLHCLRMKWPDVEFMSTDQLGTLIQQSHG